MERQLISSASECSQIFALRDGFFRGYGGAMPTPPTSPRLDGVLLRTARAADAGLIRFAALDGARPPAGPALVAEENGAKLSW
jgi:hypothetical protein